MIIASHFVAGAAIGSVSKRTRIAMPPASISHFVLDQIPHSCFRPLPGLWSDSTGQIVGALTDFAGVLVVTVLAWKLASRWTAIAAGIAAALPDPQCYISPLNSWLAMVPGWFVVPWAHKTFHIDVTTTNPALGFVTQAVVFAVGMYLIARGRRRKA